MTRPNDLILGVDGGGSKTLAWLAVRDAKDDVEVIGVGRSGSSNCRSIGFADAAANLQNAIESAFQDAKRTSTIVGSACLALAGADRPVEQQQFRSWAHQRCLADRLIITNDALPVLYAASSDGVGIALISGTGSIAVGRNAKAKVARCGGWGSLFGDEGSGYQIALAALRAAARAADGRGMETTVLPGLRDHFKISQATELIPAIYAADMTRSDIAKLAPIVFQAAELGDAVARRIVEQAADDLSELVRTLATRLEMSEQAIALGVSGGVLLHQEKFVDAICRRLAASGIAVTVTRVQHPVAGAITIAIADQQA